jgi:hypothetical protein
MQAASIAEGLVEKEVVIGNSSEESDEKSKKPAKKDPKKVKEE